MPRILHIVPNLGHGGGERVAVDLAVGLAAQGFEVGFISLFDEAAPELAYLLGRTGIPTWFLGKRMGLDPRVSCALSRALDRFKPDLIHTHRYALSYLLSAAPITLLRRKIKVVHTVHNLARFEVGLLGRTAHRLAFSMGATPVAIARQVQQSVEEVYGLHHVALIPNGVAAAPSRKPGPTAQTPRDVRRIVLGSVARFEVQKNHALLIDAFAGAYRSDENLYLVLVGDGPLRPTVQAQVARLGLEPAVAFLGYRADARELIETFDILVLSSDWEGHPLVVLEAMAAGTPVLCTAVGGCPDIVENGQTGLLVPAQDRDAMKQAILDLARNAPLRKRLGDIARQRYEDVFSSRRMVETYASLYLHLLSTRATLIRPRLSSTPSPEAMTESTPDLLRETTTRSDRPPDIVLVTPNTTVKNAAYGGGKGGYARMASVLLETAVSPHFRLRHCYHTARKRGRWWPVLLPFRLLIDTVSFLVCSRGAQAIHITLQYRNAIPREAVLCAIARLRRLPTLIDIRAGAFQAWYESAPFWYRILARYVLRCAKEITVEGSRDIGFVNQQFGRKATYFPNFVPDSEIPSNPPERCVGKTLGVVFVGYCYEGKGVFELVEGCRRASNRGVSLSLTLAGAEEPGFSSWLDQEIASGIPFSLDRRGLLQREEVRRTYEEADIFCLPSRHSGEGHSNVINEAMMWGLVILCTRHGFLDSILDEDACYFLERDLPNAIADALCDIDRDRAEARRRAQNGRRLLKERYSSSKTIPVLEATYRRMLSLR